MLNPTDPWYGSGGFYPDPWGWYGYGYDADENPGGDMEWRYPGGGYNNPAGTVRPPAPGVIPALAPPIPRSGVPVGSGPDQLAALLALLSRIQQARGGAPWSPLRGGSFYGQLPLNANAAWGRVAPSGFWPSVTGGQR